MYFLDHSLSTPEENLAWDDGLIEIADRWTPESAESQDGKSAESESRALAEAEVLRVWEMPRFCVIVGRGSNWSEEVNVEACQRDSIPIFRRISGGATVVVGPGCLMYSALVSYIKRPTWRMLDVAHREIMKRVGNGARSALSRLGQSTDLHMQGTCDLTLGDRKVSGNALRCKRKWMLYHGTLLYQFPLEVLSRWLRHPSREPEYRHHRSHLQFVANLFDSGDRDQQRVELTQGLLQAWEATDDWNASPWQTPSIASAFETEIERLIAQRYRNPDWNTSR